MKNVLITGIGGDLAQSVAKILREAFPLLRIIGSDVHQRHAGSLFVDKLISAPTAKNPTYLDWLRSVLLENEINICIPLSDAELEVIVNHKDSRFAGVNFLMQHKSVLDIGLDKYLTNIFLREIGCPVPWTLLANEYSKIPSYPCVLKPRRGSGSKNIHICYNEAAAQSLAISNTSSIFQELLLPDESEITCALYRTASGETRTLQMLRHLADSSTSWAQVINDSTLDAQLARIANSLNLRGSINIQLRLTQDGPRIFEINPRFSSTALMRHLFGFHDILWSFQEALGQAPSSWNPHNAIGNIAVRVYEVHVL